MSQEHVERLLGKLITDDAFRWRFVRDPRGTLEKADLVLTDCELGCVLRVDAEHLRAVADRLDPKLLRACLEMEDADATDQ